MHTLKLSMLPRFALTADRHVYATISLARHGADLAARALT